MTDAQYAADTIQNHPATQSVKDTIGNGPVADVAKDQHAKTTNEISRLANSRTTPDQSTATGQPLTHYHSFFYTLLSVSINFLPMFASPLTLPVGESSCYNLIFHLCCPFHLCCEVSACAALVLQSSVYGTWWYAYLTAGLQTHSNNCFLVTAAAEVAGKLVLSQGLATSFRPKKYYTLPREALESSLEDIEHLINFFVIEFQRVLFAENVGVTIASFFAAVLSYWLIKIVPFWGLSLIGVSSIYLGPLVYMTNKELIDEQLSNASDIVNTQANQVKDLAGHHTARAQETVKAYAGDYSAKAQSYIGNPRGRSTSSELPDSKSAANAPMMSEPGNAPKYSSSDFPHAPKQELTSGVTSHQEQYQSSQFGGQAEPAS